MTEAQRTTIKSPDGQQIVSLDKDQSIVYRPATEADMRHCASCTCPVEAARLCRRCGERIVWHEGNGGQWIGESPPRDWMTCFGRPEGERHEPIGPAADVAISPGGAITDA